MNQSERIEELTLNGWRKYHKFPNSWIVMWRISRDYPPLNDYITIYNDGQTDNGIIQPNQK